MKKLFFLVSVLCFHSTLCFAESCTAMPSCAELGYYRGTNMACGDDDSRYIVCPYDPDYRKCVSYDCAEMGFKKDALEELQGWCQNIIFCKKDVSYVLCGDIDGPNTVCTPKYCTAVAVPSHATGISPCTPQSIDCEYGDQVYTSWTCNPGYHINTEGTACEQDCVISVCSAVTVPENAHGTGPCSPKRSDCSFGDEVYTAWACNSGFHMNLAGTACVQDCTPQTCNAGVSVPANAHGTNPCTPRGTDCSTGTMVYGGWACDEGYHANGANTACVEDCTVQTCGTGVSVPAHAHGINACTPRAKNCSEGTTVYADWVCDTNYHKKGSACEADCTVQTCGAGVSIPSNAHGINPCTPRETNCSEGTTVYADFECDTNYHRKNSACEADCTAVTCGTAVAVPEHAHCTNSCTPTGTNCSSTGVERCLAWDCDSGWYKDGDVCKQNPTCTEIVCAAAVTVPSHAHCTNHCTPMDTSCHDTGAERCTAWDCDSGWHKSGNTCVQNPTCTPVNCVAVSIPQHAEGTEPCTPLDASCNEGTTVNTDWACVSGYHKNAGGTGCDQNCTPVNCTVATPPAHAHGTNLCTRVYSDCSTSDVYTDWECDTGWHKVGGACVQNCTVNVCTKSVSVPANAHGTDPCTPVDANCSEGDLVYGGWECNSGYHKNSGGTGCEKDCTPSGCTAATIPGHAHGTTECTPVNANCSNGTKVYTAWACDTNYHQKGSACEADCTAVTCASGTYPYTSAPSNGTLSGAECVPTATDCSTDTKRYADFKCNTNYCKDGSPKCTKTSTCSEAYAEGTSLSNGSLSGTACTAISGGTTENCTRTKYYPDFTCDEGYCKSGTPGCTQTKTCTENKAPTNATCTSTCTPISGTTTTSCTTGDEVCTAWSCNSGYHQNAAGTGCNADCAVVNCTAVTVPNNAHGTTSCTPRDKNCNESASVYTAWACDSGYHKNAAGTGCNADCSVVNCTAVTVPNNAHGTTTCTPRNKNCNEGTTVYTAWACNTGYTLNSAGTGCDDCSNEYSSSNGWTTTKPACYTNEVSCGGLKYYRPLICSEATRVNEDKDFYPWTNRYVPYKFQTRLDEATCRCVVDMVSPRYEADIQSCPPGLYQIHDSNGITQEVTYDDGGVTLYDVNHNLTLCDSFWGGDEYDLYEGLCQREYGPDYHPDNFGGEAAICSPCDYTSGYRWNPGIGGCIYDEYLLINH